MEGAEGDRGDEGQQPEPEGELLAGNEAGEGGADPVGAAGRGGARARLGRPGGVVHGGSLQTGRTVGGVQSDVGLSLVERRGEEVFGVVREDGAAAPGRDVTGCQPRPVTDRGDLPPANPVREVVVGEVEAAGVAGGGGVDPAREPQGGETGLAGRER